MIVLAIAVGLLLVSLLVISIAGSMMLDFKITIISGLASVITFIVFIGVLYQTQTDHMIRLCKLENDLRLSETCEVIAVPVKEEDGE